MANMTNLAEALGPWLKASRWYSGGPAAVESAIELAGEWEATVLWLVLASGSTRHNVPVVLRDAAGDADDAPRPVASLGGLRVFDAAEDRDGQRALLALACGTEAVHAVASGDVGDPEATLAKLPTSVRTAPAEDAPAPPARVSSAKRLTSEQSNTSIVYTMEDGERLILKIFRVLVPGSNPDVHLQAVLSDTGTVPRARGAAHLTWDGQDADVLVAQEFLGGARDAWQVITEGLADSDGSLGAAAESIPRLGELTRRIHDTLAKRCPRVEAEATDRKRIRAAWSRRAADACALVLGLEPWKERIEEVFARTENVTWPPLQRIHGDYHLGQVLDAPDRGWVALDFEGEPLRPLAERNTPDLAMRDVAGMIRSFGYATGSAVAAGADEETMAAWEKAAVDAFLTGYGDIGAHERVLLDALILDKALYEVSYEAAQRPTWLPIPLAGAARILGADPHSLSASH